METKFTPWRMNYIRRGDNPEPCACVFCGIAAAETHHDAQNLILYRGETCFVVMNLYPYNTAHLMVVPYLHTSDMPGLRGDVSEELFSLTQRCVRILGAVYAPHGYNIGMNLGSIAGAGIAEHLHMHIVPRWSGDTNFMPIIGGTKLVPEDLDDTYQRLLPAFRS